MRPVKILALTFGALAACLITLALVRPSGAAPRGADQRAVLLGEEAVLLPPPEAVAPAVIAHADWSPTGRYLLLVRQFMQLPPRPESMPETSLLLWNGDSRQTRELWKTADPNALHGTLQWLPGTEVALGLVNQTVPRPPAKPGEPPAMDEQRWLLRVDARRGLARPVLRVGNHSQFLVSSSLPLGLLSDSVQKTLHLVQADGTLKPVVRLPEGTEPGASQWSADGTSITLTAIFHGPKKNSITARLYRLDPRTGVVTPLPETILPETPAEPPSGPLRLTRAPAAVKQGETVVRIGSLWLEATQKTEAPRAMIAADADEAELSPRGDALYFFSQGSAFVQPLVRVPKAVYVAMRDAARRAVLMSNAKQLGLGALMYSQDYDEILPGAHQAVEQILQPYVKNTSIFEGFTYTYGGGPLAEIAEPAKTLLGYTPGPGGRVNLFADGHVEWAADGAPPK